MTKTDFLALAIPAAQAASAVSGFPPGVTVAQAAVESGWGAKAPGNNYFGLTCEGDAPSELLQTQEDMTLATMQRELASGRITSIVSQGAPNPTTGIIVFQVMRRFGAWSSARANFEARDHVIATEPVYVAARMVVNAPRAFLAAVARHWATNPHYGLLVQQVYDENNLAQLDTNFYNSQAVVSGS